MNAIKRLVYWMLVDAFTFVRLAWMESDDTWQRRYVRHGVWLGHRPADDGGIEVRAIDSWRERIRGGSVAGLTAEERARLEESEAAE